MYGKDSEQLIIRPKEIYDGATPSGNSVSTLNFLRLARLTGDHKLEQLAQKQFEYFGSIVKAYPSGYSYFLIALLFSSTTTKEIVITGNPEQIDTKAMLQTINDAFLPHAVFHINVQSNVQDELAKLVPFLADQKSLTDTATAYICENYSCQAPITDASQFAEILDSQLH